ncbi:MAG: NADH:flavin oxidoreductase/NADH oxidase [Rhodospirillaceae bacterium]|jgi:2,4-dienoyl-CoA reductase-like NADH-dependent reductase (Old Yellow Enzyme family)|nr:NADH:flavin oxidoreductase/NADH oxidase [Rhodospirillaceae bacterium]
MGEEEQAEADGKSLLFSPITIRGVTARNRVMVAPMCQYHSVDGGPTDWEMVHIGRLAVGGPGILFGEETGVEERGRKTHACAGIWDDRHIPQYRRLTDFIREQGVVPAIQLGHSGRKASCHGAVRDWAPLRSEDAVDGLPPWQGIAPSQVPLDATRPPLKVMDRDDIRTVLNSWREATRRSLEAGYEILEIHGAHGYLIHEFLSPITNQRNDAYGGDREGRMRFALEVAEVVRDAWPDDKPLFFRVSAVDGKGGQWGLEDTVALSRELVARGVDVVDCSSGGILGESDMPPVPRVPGYQVGFAERVKRETGAMTVAVGLITEAEQAEAILREGRADIIALARELLWYADWPAHAARQLGADADYILVPEEYAHRLRAREAAKDMPINQGGEETKAAIRYLMGEG